jgi:hypothetical protein
MRSQPCMLFLVVLALSTAVAAQAANNQSTNDAGIQHDGNAWSTESVRLAEELKKLQDGLPAKKKELARLHRKWVVVKGRMPTADELKKFEEKQADGEVKIEDNPYVNNNPLSSPGRHREAYYRKLYEIRNDEERIAALQDRLNALKP